MSFLFEPYYVHTPWFFALVLFAVVGTVAGLMRLRQLALKRRERMLIGLVADRTSELEMLAGLAEHINSP